MKNIKAFIERGEEGNFSVYIKNNTTLNYGIHGTGKTTKEAVVDFVSSYQSMKKFHDKIGKKFVEAEFDFQYDVASFLNYYSKILSLSGLEKITGINQSQLSHYLNGYRNPSRRTIEKIEKNLHSFGKELSQVQFSD